MRGFLLLLFGFGGLWDVATTVYGTWMFFDNKTVFPLIASMAFGAVILAIIGSTIWIWKTEGGWGILFKIAWCTALIYDLITSLKGNYELLLNQNVEGMQLLLLIGLTAFMTLSPILWVYVYRESEMKFS